VIGHCHSHLSCLPRRLLPGPPALFAFAVDASQTERGLAATRILERVVAEASYPTRLACAGSSHEARPDPATRTDDH